MVSLVKSSSYAHVTAAFYWQQACALRTFTLCTQTVFTAMIKNRVSLPNFKPYLRVSSDVGRCVRRSNEPASAAVLPSSAIELTVLQVGITK
jgi:hypothetical protein